MFGDDIGLLQQAIKWLEMNNEKDGNDTKD